MTDAKYMVVGTYDHGNDKLVTVLQNEFDKLEDAVSWSVQISKKHGVAGDGTISYLEVTSLDPDENLYIFCSTIPEETDALEDYISVR